MFVMGDFTTADTLYLPFDTYDSAGASVTITGLAVTDIEIYKDGSVTQRASDNGYALLDTDGIDFDGAVGLHGFSVDLSDNSDAGFYAAGSQYWINVNAITVDSQTVRFTYWFSIGRLLKPTTAGRTLDIAATGEAGVDLGNVTGTLTQANVGWVDANSRVDVASMIGDATTLARFNILYGTDAAYSLLYAGPRGPGVYLNDAAANTNTTNGTDGTFLTPVSTIAAAKTLADSMGFDRIYLVNNSDVTLAATMEDYEIIGIGEMMANTVTLGSQDVDRTVFKNLLLTGVQGGTGRCQPEGCVLSVISGMEVTSLNCLLADAGSLTLRNDCAFDGWWSAVAGGGSPKLNINSVANVNAYMRHGSGGIQIDNAVATTVMSIETDGQVIVGATCTSLEVHVRGNCSITDNGTTTDLTRDAAISRTGLVGGDYALDADANGRIRIVDGTGAGEIDTSSGTIKITDGTLTASTFAANAIDAAAIADDAIDAGSFATDAISADALATDAVNEIRNAITGGAYALNTTALGNIGINWASIENQGTIVGLTATTIFRVTSTANLTASERNLIADAVLVRGVSNVEDTADRHSLGAMIMIISNGSISGTTLTAKKPSDDSTFQTYTVTVDASADPITGVE